MMKRLPEFRDQVLSNGTYKFVALVASIVLWLTVLGRKDSEMVRELNVEFLVNPAYVAKLRGDGEIKLKLKGPRMALRKFVNRNEAIVLNLNNKKPGYHRISISKDKSVDLPLGVSILSLRPSFVEIDILPKQ